MLLFPWLNSFAGKSDLRNPRYDRVARARRRKKLGWNNRLTAVERLEDRTLLAAPVGVDDSYSVEQDGSLYVEASGVLDNDNDPDSDPTEAHEVDPPEFGSLSLDLDGGFTYDPDPGYEGPDSFTYQVYDSFEQLWSNVVTVDISVDPSAGDPPAFTSSSFTFSIAETAAMSDLVGTVTATDPDDDVDSFDIDSGDDDGAFQIDTAGEISLTADDALDFETTPNYMLTVSVWDSEGNSDTATVTINVNPAATAPDADDDYLTTDMNLDLPITIDDDLLGNDTDNGSGLQFDSFDTTLTFGTVVDNLDGTLTYTPPIDFEGSDEFDYTVVDDSGTLSNTATVFIDVLAYPPEAEDDYLSTDMNLDLVISIDDDLLVNDTDNGGGLQFDSFDTTATLGTVVDNLDGTLTYTPPIDFEGSDEFDYTVVDDSGTLSDTATVFIDVIAYPPAAEDDYLTTDMNLDLLITIDDDLLANDTDNGSGLQFDSFDTTSTLGTVVDNLDGTLTYTPPIDFEGSDEFDYTVVDDSGTLNDTATVFIDVADTGAEENTPPVANDESATTDEDVPISIAVMANDTDDDGDDLSISFVSATNGTAIVNDSGTPDDSTDDTIDFMPDPDFNGTATIDYTVNDGTVDSNLATVTITVNAVDDPPMAEANGDYYINEDDALLLSSAGTMDPDTPLGSLIFRWDLDGDTTTWEATGTTPSITWTELSSYGYSLGTTQVITLEVDDGTNTDSDQALVSVVDGLVVWIDDVEVAEDDGAADFLVSISAPQSTDVTVTFSTNEVTPTEFSATDGLDYMGVTSGSVTIFAGFTTATVSIPILTDADDEAEEYFTLDLLSTTAGTIVDGQGWCAIADGAGGCACACGSNPMPPEPPEFDDDDDPDFYDFSVPEGAGFGDTVGTAVAATFAGDPTYAITGGDPGNVFSIAPATGRIVVADPSQLVAGTSYLLDLQVSDGFGSDTATAQITVVVGGAPAAAPGDTWTHDYATSYGGKWITISAGSPKYFQFRQTKGPNAMPLLPWPRTDYWYGQWGHRTDGSFDPVGGGAYAVTGTNTIMGGEVCNTVGGGKDAGAVSVRAGGFSAGVHSFRVDFQISIAATDRFTGGGLEDHTRGRSDSAVEIDCVTTISHCCYRNSRHRRATGRYYQRQIHCKRSTYRNGDKVVACAL